jgi:hypothetical protein
MLLIDVFPVAEQKSAMGLQGSIGFIVEALCRWGRRVLIAKLRIAPD